MVSPSLAAGGTYLVPSFAPSLALSLRVTPASTPTATLLYRSVLSRYFSGVVPKATPKPSPNLVFTHHRPAPPSPHPHHPTRAVFHAHRRSPTGRNFMSGGEDGSLILWSPKSGAAIMRIDHKTQHKFHKEVRCSHCPAVLASMSFHYLPPTSAPVPAPSPPPPPVAEGGDDSDMWAMPTGPLSPLEIWCSWSGLTDGPSVVSPLPSAFLPWSQALNCATWSASGDLVATGAQDGFA